MFTRTLVLIVSILLSQAVCAAPEPSSCDQGEAALQESQFAIVVSKLTDCLANPNLESTARRRALQVRAWANFNLHKDGAAVVDQEASFKLEPPRDYNEFTNYSSYLRRVSRYGDSLSALRAAEAIDQRSGRSSMMTQYNIGWTLTELKKYDEAVKVLTQAIPLQPDFPFTYWRRALALEALGRPGEARKDIEIAASILMRGSTKFPDDEFKAALRKKLHQYDLTKKYPI